MAETISNSSFVTYRDREIVRVPSQLCGADRVGGWKARWAFNRMRYVVEPGLYAVGDPDEDSVVLVSANYKLSFDHLRSRIAGLDAWILVIDTKGINVWCAAGKGTFCGDEIARRIEEARLGEIVSHRRIILPQLSAPGVKAHEVTRQSGFRVVYGPVLARDVRAFIDADMKATAEMRRVRFPMADRIATIPVEIVVGSKYVIFAMACMFLLAGFCRSGYDSSLAMSRGLPGIAVLFLSYLAGVVLGPILLPWLPGKAFSLKGLWVGVGCVLVFGLLGWPVSAGRENWLTVAALALIMPTITSFIVMNFTGASTYTSLSGVRREMRYAVPLQALCAVAAIVMWTAGGFI